MKVKDKEFKKYLAKEDIQKRIEEIAKSINSDYEGECPLFIAILNGSFMFAADLMKRIKLEAEISFVKVASYSSMESTGNLKELIGLNENVFNRAVVLIEDIIDSGKTMENLLGKLTELGPKSVEVATLLVKPEALATNLSLKYVGFEIPNDFVIGYGLDYDGLGRNLEDIYQVK